VLSLETTATHNAERTRAMLLLAATALLWSSGGLAIKLVDLGPFALTGVRSALSALTLLLLLRGAVDLRLTPARLGAAASYACMLLSNVAATKMTTSANAILLAYTAPVYVALLAPRLLGESTRPRDWLFVVAVLCGMSLFFMDRLSPTGLWGNVVAVGTGMSYAAFTLFMRRQKDASPIDSVVLGHILTAAVGLPFLVTGPLPDASGWIGVAYLGIIQQGVSLALYAWAIKRLGALEAILIMTLEPILNPAWVAVGTGEIPGPWALAGGAVVLASVTLRGTLGALRRPGQLRAGT
jgi:drug/metabolite transporter (DMT)-like permease